MRVNVTRRLLIFIKLLEGFMSDKDLKPLPEGWQQYRNDPLGATSPTIDVEISNNFIELTYTNGNKDRDGREEVYTVSVPVELIRVLLARLDSGVKS